MKKQLHRFLFSTVAVIASVNVNAQQVATFENLTLSPDTYWDGASTPNGTTFISGDAIFPNYNTGTYWTRGWAYSNKKDSTTAGYTNMYSAVTAEGYNSENYAVGTQNAKIYLNSTAAGGIVNGLYVTNGTYAAISMRDGDSFAKKFGDTTKTNSGLPQGSYPDWYKLAIRGYYNGVLTTDSVEFYLADYRFADDSKDYIVKTWEWVDLTSLGNVDSLIFRLYSSDVGEFGINTPLYFCIDNFTTPSPLGIAKVNSSAIKMYPNPVTENLSIDLSGLNNFENHIIEVADVAGKRIELLSVNNSLINLPVASYKAGVYFISVRNEHTVINAKFIKQ